MKSPTPSNILFYQEETDFQLPQEDQTIEWLRKVAALESVQIDTLCYIFCSDDYLLNINQTYLQHNYFTDIITFPYESDPIIADLFISIDRVSENAQAFETGFDHEIHRVMVHGLLHLIGFDDHEESDKTMMRKKENDYLRLLPPNKILSGEEE